MTLTKRISAAIRAFRAHEEYDEKKWQEWMRGPVTKSGARINEVSSLSIPAVFAAINFLASTFATLPKVVLRRLPGGGAVRAYDHPLYDRLHNKPNDSGLTAWQWIYTSAFHKYLWGNWYTWVDRESYLRQQFIPLLPDRTYPDPENNDRFVTYRKDGQRIPQPIYLLRSEVLHIPHISLDGVSGKGVIHYARESLGVARAQDEFAATFYGHGIHAGGFVQVPVGGTMSEETRKGLQEDFNQKYGGLGRSWKAIFLTGGAEFKEAAVDAQKAQALESRQFSVVEVSRWMNLPPHVLRELSRATFSNIEQQGIELVIYSILPATTQIEQAMNVTFFDEEERKTHFVKFELKGLLRGDLKARTEFYTAMLDRGVFSADQVLELEDMNPQPNGLGRLYVLPLNMVNKELVVSPQPLTINAPRSLVAERDVQLIDCRSSGLRRKLTIAYKKQFDAYGQRIVELETQAVRAAAKEMLAQRGTMDFLAWLDTFYQEFAGQIDSFVAPLLSSYAEAVLPIAQTEINSEAEIGPQYEQFQREFREYFVGRHVDSSRGQLRSIVLEAQQAGKEPADAIEARLSEWEQKRPGKIAMRESLRAESAFARSIFALSGIAKIRSVYYGKNCPYCRALHGRVIGISEFFLTKGEFQPEGADRPLIVTGNRSHPPYHDGCDCGIEASR